MKNQIKILILGALTVGLLLAQTGLNVEQLQARTEGQILLRIGAGPFNIHLANLSPAFTINTTTSPPTLEVNPVLITLEWYEQPYIELAGATTDFVITNNTFIPSSLMVFRNLGFMFRGVDYTLTGMMIQFVPLQVPQIGDNVMIRYQATNP